MGRIDPDYAWIEAPMGIRRRGLVWRQGAWRMVIGSPAWSDFYGWPEESGWETNPDTGTSWDDAKPVTVPKAVGPAAPASEAGVSSAMEDGMATEYTNDPKLGVVPVGQPTNQDAAGTVWRMPSRLVAKLMPVGPVASWVGTVFDALPWIVWGLLAWVAWKRTKR